MGQLLELATKMDIQEKEKVAVAMNEIELEKGEYVSVEETQVQRSSRGLGEYFRVIILSLTEGKHHTDLRRRSYPTSPCFCSLCIIFSAGHDQLNLCDYRWKEFHSLCWIMVITFPIAED
jgi:hypothetical protein